MHSLFLIRYGVMRYVGWFSAEGGDFRRGDLVVARTQRGEELGEIIAVDSAEPPLRASLGSILRPAGRDDLTRAAERRGDQPRRLNLCESMFGEGQWPFDLIDVEVLLDDLTVVYYLGPHGLETEGIRQSVFARCSLALRFEPVGGDEPAVDDDHGCGSCGSSSGGGCGSGAGGGCGGCGVKDLAARRRAVLSR
jgi:hypothetical protein